MLIVEPQSQNQMEIRGEYTLHNDRAWLMINGMIVCIKIAGTGLDVRVWEDHKIHRVPFYEANINPHWRDSAEDDGPCPNALWYDTSKELE